MRPAFELLVYRQTVVVVLLLWLDRFAQGQLVHGVCYSGHGHVGEGVFAAAAELVEQLARRFEECCCSNGHLESASVCQSAVEEGSLILRAAFE